MKKFVCYLLLGLLPFVCHAQQSRFDELYEKYAKITGVQAQQVSKSKLSAARIAASGFPKSITGIKSIIIEDKNKLPKGVSESFDKEVEQLVKSCPQVSQYEQNGHYGKLYTYRITDDGKLTDLILHLTGYKVQVAIQYSGIFDRDEKFITEMGKRK